jgi:hypothetical protein
MATKYSADITAPTIVTGARAVSDVESTRLKIDISDDILQYDPNANSLTLLSVKMNGKREVGQFQFYWLEKDRMPRADTVGATGYDADDTSIVVSNGGRFRKWDEVLVESTGERFLVTAVSTNTLTVTRGLNSSGKVLAAGSNLRVIGNAYVEGGDVGTAKSVKAVPIYNLCQQVRTPFSFTGRDQVTRMYGGNDPDIERKWQGVEHSISIEQIFWWGYRDTQTDATSGKNITFAGGVDQYVQTLEWDINQTEFNERNLTESMEVGFRWGRGGRQGKKSKTLFSGCRYITEIEGWAKNRLYYVPSDSIYGLDAMVYKSAHGKIVLIDHPLFDEENADKAFLMDLNHLKYVYHVGRDTKLLKDRGDNGVDGSTEEYLSDISLELKAERSHMKFSNLPV